jgi:hypothetical protein
MAAFRFLGSPDYHGYDEWIDQSVSNPSMRLIRSLSIALVAIVLLASIAVAIARYEIRRNADRIIGSSYELFQHEQRPSLDDVKKRFGDELRQTSPCEDFGCGFEVVQSNRLLVMLHLAQPTTLKSEFWVRNGGVDENIVQFWTTGENRRMALAYTDAKYCKSCNDFSSGSSVNIDLGSQAPQKRGAFGFNTNCLLSIRGCATSGELLPSIQHN